LKGGKEKEEEKVGRGGVIRGTTFIRRWLIENFQLGIPSSFAFMLVVTGCWTNAKVMGSWRRCGCAAGERSWGGSVLLRVEF